MESLLKKKDGDSISQQEFDTRLWTQGISSRSCWLISCYGKALGSTGQQGNVKHLKLRIPQMVQRSTSRMGDEGGWN